jgi:hypothetical protein
MMIGVLFRKLVPMTLFFSDFCMFFWITLKVSDLTLMSLIHFDLILVQCKQQGSASIGVLHVDIQFY